MRGGHWSAQPDPHVEAGWRSLRAGVVWLDDGHGADRGEGGQSETKRNRTTKKTGFLRGWSLTTVNPLSSCWTNVFFWVDVPIFLSITSHQMALSP